jgi:predicted  nucleic acid-binding Zn-ribbon protein
MHEQLGTVGFVLSLTLVLLGAFFRYTLIRQDAERDRRFRSLEGDVELLKRAAHAAEVSVIRVEGQLAVLRSEHESVVSVLEEIRTDMLGRREWEVRMNTFEDSLRGIREQLQTVARLIGKVEGAQNIKQNPPVGGE